MKIGKKTKLAILEKFIGRFLLFILLLTLCGFARYFFSQENKIVKSQEKLSTILEKTGDYCEKVKKMALFYVCKEKIVKKRYFYKTETYRKKLQDAEAWAWTSRLKVKGTKKNTYTYDYQLIKKGDELKERRILLEEDGKKKLEESAELKMVKYVSKYLVYGPVGFMSKYWQDYFDYEIVGKDIEEGKEAIILNSFPMSAIEENDNYGRIWVDEEDFSILKIEWDPKSIKDYEEEVIPSPIGDLEKEMIWSVSYCIEKNGVRFPSKQVIQEFLINEEGKKFIHQETLFNYVDYKFFKVEVDVNYRSPNHSKRKGLSSKLSWEIGLKMRPVLTSQFSFSRMVKLKNLK